MSVATTNKNLFKEAIPRSMFRIALPSYKIGWRNSKSHSKKPSEPTREEFQNLFKDDFRRSGNLAITLTPEERVIYNESKSSRADRYCKDHN